MQCVRLVTDDLYWVGANDKRLHLFESIHPIEGGVSYNSYLLLDEQTVLFDTADKSVYEQFCENVEYVLDGRHLDYMVINHLEPDHAASINEIILRHPDVKVVSTERALMLMHQYGYEVDEHFIEVKEGDTMTFGKHTVTFVAAPMVHWPEVMVTFDVTNGVLFSADGFGSFKSLDGCLFADEVDFKNEWIDEARRYYCNIVGKYGPQVMELLKKAGTIDIKMICPLHGPVWREDLGWIIDKYVHWATYEPEEKGILICYASMYGHTENAAQILASKLHQKGFHNIHMYDVAETHVSYLIGEAFKYSHMALLSVTYNLNLFPPMQNFVDDMKRLNLQKRVVALVENGSWAPQACGIMEEAFDEMKQMTILNEQVSVLSAVNKMTEKELDGLADSLIESMSQDYFKKEEAPAEEAAAAPAEEAAAAPAEETPAEEAAAASVEEAPTEAPTEEAPAEEVPAAPAEETPSEVPEVAAEEVPMPEGLEEVPAPGADGLGEAAAEAEKKKGGFFRKNR